MIEIITDQWVNNTTGSYKNSGWEKNRLTKATKEEVSKTSSDLSKIPWVTSVGKPTDGQIQLPSF